MPYVALKQIEVKNRVQRMRGEVVPEAMEWTDPGIWESAGHVKFVPDSEIQDGRWIYAKDYGGASASAKAPPNIHVPPSPPPSDDVSDAPARRDEAGDAAHHPDPEPPGAPAPQAEAHAEEQPRRQKRRVRDMMR